MFGQESHSKWGPLDGFSVLLNISISWYAVNIMMVVYAFTAAVKFIEQIYDSFPELRSMQFHLHIRIGNNGSANKRILEI